MFYLKWQQWFFHKQAYKRVTIIETKRDKFQRTNNDVFTNRHAKEKTVPIIKTKRDKFKRTNWIESHKRAEDETDLETFVYFENVENEAEQGRVEPV